MSHTLQGKGWKLAHALYTPEDQYASTSVAKQQPLTELLSPISSDNRASSRFSLGGASIEPLILDQKASTCDVAVRERINASHDVDGPGITSPAVTLPKTSKHHTPKTLNP